jgi:hypothetical protein
VDDSKDNIFPKQYSACPRGFPGIGPTSRKGKFKSKSNTTASWAERCEGAVRCWRRSGAIPNSTPEESRPAVELDAGGKKDQSNAGKRRAISSGVSRYRSNWLARAVQGWQGQINIFGGFPVSVHGWPARAIQRWKEQVNISGLSRHRSTDGRQERFDAGKSKSTFFGGFPASVHGWPARLR